MRQLIQQSVIDTIQTIVPENINRNWYMDYLFKYTFGNRLPRCKKMNCLKIVSDTEKWISFCKDINHDLEHVAFKNQISPFLLNQKALLSLMVIHRLCELNVNYIIEVIKKLEGLPSNGKTELIKHNKGFKKGALNGYKHHHVPLLPNSYFSMLAATDKNSNLINLNSIVNNISIENGVIDFDLNQVESEISARGAKKGGRLTGHWLITKEVNGKNFYLGIFPHSNGKVDDAWIKHQLLESERVAVKHA